MATKNTIFSGFMLAIVGAILFSAKGLLIKYAYSDGLATETILLYRMGLAFPVFAFIALKKGIKSFDARDIPGILFCGIFGYYLAAWLSFYSLHFISVQLERIILFSYPSLVVLGTAILARRLPSPKVIVAALLSYLGVITIFASEWLNSKTGTQTSVDVAFGTALVGLSAAFFAAYVIASKRLIGKYGSATFTGASMSVSTVAIIIHTSAVAFNHSDLTLIIPPANSLPIILILTFFGTLIPTFMLSEAVARIGTERTAISGTVGPLAASLLAVLFLNEAFTPYHALSLALCTLGIILIAKRTA
ncbi:MAG: DMT family transporter [Alphaproteobacteria bacterium]|nr:DMT family transporter [Alphaproteobacteria bacterium]